MKNLEKNKNIYIQHGRFYIDCQKDGVRIRRATGLKKSPLAFDFVRKNYDLFLGSKSDIAEAKRRYRELEDLQTDRLLRKGEKGAGAIKNSSEFSFDSVIDRLLAEKSFLKDKTRRLYTIMSHTITEFLSFNGIFYLADFERHIEKMADWAVQIDFAYCFLSKLLRPRLNQRLPVGGSVMDYSSAN